MLERPSTPAYVAIADALRRRITEQREWVPGERIPSHRALMQEYGATDGTIQAARRLLIEEGLLEPHPGAGVFVRRREPRRRIARNRAGTSDAQGALSLRQQEDAAGRLGEWSCRSKAATADRALAQLLHIAYGDRVMETCYQFRAAGQITRLTTCWEPMSVVDATEIILPEDGPLAGRSVRERMAAIGVTVGECEDEVVARPATVAEGDLLGGGGSAVLEVTRLYRDTDGRPVHAERTVVRGDRGALLYRL
jgi:DNA-binding GntR family transcriptional regulator